MPTNLARFPFVKGLDGFDFSCQPALDKKQIQTLADWHFVEQGDNVILLGPQGVGKTHLAVGLGLKPLSPLGLEDFYDVINERYERGSLIVTSNRALAEWRDLFQNPVLRSAGLDRLTHNAHQIVITGDGFRAKKPAPRLGRSKEVVAPIRQTRPVDADGLDGATHTRPQDYSGPRKLDSRVS